MMRLQWTSELHIDALDAKGHWATLGELLESVRCCLPRYESVLKSCKDNIRYGISLGLVVCFQIPRCIFFNQGLKAHVR